MHKHSTLAELAAKWKLEITMKKLDKHISVLGGAIETVDAQILVVELGVAAARAVAGQRTRSEVDEISKSVAAALHIPPYVTDAYVDFQIAMIELSQVIGKSIKGR